MKFKHFGVISLVTLGMLTGGGVSAFAADQTEGDAVDGRQATSYGEVELKAGDEEVTEPLDPDDGGKTGNKGLLTIDNVSPLDFGSQNISSQTKTYPSLTKSANVQVTDKRGSGEGWTLKVSASRFVDKNENAKTLKGAVLNFPKGFALTDSTNQSMPAATYAVELETDKDIADSKVIMDAQIGEGLGTWVDQFQKDEAGNPSADQNVELTIPTGNLKGVYSSTLNWNLEDGPQA